MGKLNNEPRFSLLFFFSTIAISLLSFLLILALLATATWRIQITASFSAILIVFLAMHFVNAFIEYIFHRYVLHAPLVPLLSYFYKQHTIHHGLTRVIRRKIDSGPELRIENKYSIVEALQHRASFFPWYSFLIFGILLTPFFAFAQWLMPTAPIFLGGFLALAWSISLYEIIHALEHFPLEKWKLLFKRPCSGRLWKVFYAFHLRHHADIYCNEAISGFFGLPIADLVFGTWINPSSLYKDRSIAEAEDFKSPKPRFIGWLDKLSDRKIKNRIKRAIT